MKPAIKGTKKRKEVTIDPTLPLKRGRKPKSCAEVEFIIPESIFYGLVISSPPLKKHTRRPPHDSASSSISITTGYVNWQFFCI